MLLPILDATKIFPMLENIVYIFANSWSYWPQTCKHLFFFENCQNQYLSLGLVASNPGWNQDFTNTGRYCLKFYLFLSTLITCFSWKTVKASWTCCSQCWMKPELGHNINLHIFFCRGGVRRQREQEPAPDFPTPLGPLQLSLPGPACSNTVLEYLSTCFTIDIYIRVRKVLGWFS